jgi:hypothetical protein
MLRSEMGAVDVGRGAGVGTDGTPAATTGGAKKITV